MKTAIDPAGRVVVPKALRDSRGPRTAQLPDNGVTMIRVAMKMR
jgi:hypothetical protein